MAGRIGTFLLTAEKSAGRIAEQVRHLRHSTVQLVDTLPAGEIATLRRLAPQVTVVTVIHVLDPDSIGKAIKSAQASDALLLDSGNPNLAAKELGGTGRTHDWEASKSRVTHDPKQRKAPTSGAFLKAGDGTRTRDPQLGRPLGPAAACSLLLRNRLTMWVSVSAQVARAHADAAPNTQVLAERLHPATC